MSRRPVGEGEEGVGIFADPGRRQWMNLAFTALAAQGLVRVVMLELNGECISYRLGLLDQGRLYDYNLAFLPQHADLGSGRVLLEEWIRWGLDEKLALDRRITGQPGELQPSVTRTHDRPTGTLALEFLFMAARWFASGICLATLEKLEAMVWQTPKQTDRDDGIVPPKNQEKTDAASSDRQR